ncbi:MAG: hypothetical protein ACYDHM_02285 [Acidiferrobacterales bacterium]
MFKSYEVSPVCSMARNRRTSWYGYSSREYMIAFRRHCDAVKMAARTGNPVEFGLYGVQDDGRRQHVADRPSIQSMRELIRELFGFALPAWAGDRLAFSLGRA